MTDNQIAFRLAVLGAGVMGISIATLAIGTGLPVVLIDIDAAKLDRAHLDVAKQLRMAQLMGARSESEPVGELRTSTSAHDATDATVVIEAISEIADSKIKALGELATILRPGTPIVSNTSSIPINELAESLARPEELIGAHFMNPPYLIETVEVARGVYTSDATMRRVSLLLATLGRKAIIVRDAPGFVTSRLLHPMINNAIRVVQEGTATVCDIDTLMQGCLGHRTGPLRTADLIGLDNLVDSLQILHERTGDQACIPCELLIAKVQQGHLGRKNGRGFYQYEEAVP